MINGHRSKHFKLQDKFQIATKIWLLCAALSCLILIYRPGWPQSYGDFPASASQMSRLKIYSIVASNSIICRAIKSHLLLFSWIMWPMSSLYPTTNVRDFYEFYRLEFHFQLWCTQSLWFEEIFAYDNKHGLTFFLWCVSIQPSCSFCWNVISPPDCLYNCIKSV